MKRTVRETRNEQPKPAIVIESIRPSRFGRGPAQAGDAEGVTVRDRREVEK
jgi:hypothetical protein